MKSSKLFLVCAKKLGSVKFVSLNHKKTLPMYQVLYKDTIKREILPYLSVAKRGYPTKSKAVGIVNAILYKLKTGVQWAYLPVKSLFSEVVLSYKSVFWHFRKWCSKLAGFIFLVTINI